MSSSRSNLFTNCNFTGGTEIGKGTTFGSQNQSGGDRFWRGDQNFRYTQIIAHKSIVSIELINVL